MPNKYNLPDGHYRFTADTTLTDRSGNPLDGDGDGSGGDVYQRVFDVALPAEFGAFGIPYSRLAMPKPRA